MSPPVAQALSQAYVFLRRVEHRIQYLDDQQTHILPTCDEDLFWIARTMGYADTCGFMQDLLYHRDIIAREFDTLLSRDGPCKTCSPAKQPSASGEASKENTDFSQLAAQAAASGHATVQQRLLNWQEQPRLAALRPQSRKQIWRLVENSLKWLSQTPQDGQG